MRVFHLKEIETKKIELHISFLDNPAREREREIEREK